MDDHVQSFHKEGLSEANTH